MFNLNQLRTDIKNEIRNKQQLTKIENNGYMNKCDDIECFFNKNKICLKKGKCMKKIDNSFIIKSTVEDYWKKLRAKYDEKYRV